jgi:hypothetical protein
VREIATNHRDLSTRRKSFEFEWPPLDLVEVDDGLIRAER